MKTEDSVCAICNCRIRDNALFTRLSAKELHVFKNVVTTVSYSKKEVVFTEGDECKGLYIVKSGRIKLVRSSSGGREQIIKILAPGDLLGLEVFYDGIHYENNAVAMEDSDLCFISKADFLRTITTEPTIAAKLVISMGKELHDAYERIGSLGLMSAKEKLASLLLSLAREHGVKEDGGVRLHLRLSRLDMAELLGITQETSIRLLKSLKEAGVIEIKRKDIFITSMDKLARIGAAGR
ncbi:MAG: Crp/Fnr family transcriptional regulator [Thermodesulfobacteriota bacterium]